MTIENLKQIAIKYATTKGSCVPLAPDELCNAVVQYFNEFLKITADINTLQVAVTEEGGNIVFTITGNTLDGKAFTPIVITVDHNDFVTNQEFEEFKTSVTKQLNNKRSVISSPASSYVVYTQANGLESNLPYSELANKTSTNIMARRADGRSDVKKGVSGENIANMENISDVIAKIPDTSNLATKAEVNNKLDKSTTTSSVYIVDGEGNQKNIPYASNVSQYTIVYRDANSNFVVNTPTENDNPTPKSYVDNALANKRDKITSPISNSVLYANIDGNDRQISYNASSIPNTVLYRNASGKTAVAKGVSDQDVANMENISDVIAKIPSTTNLADVTKENTFTDVNHFTQYITSFGVEIGTGNADDDEYDVSIQESGIEIFHYISGSKANSLRITENKIMTIVYPSNEYNIFDFPNKSGTLALTSDIPDIPDTSSFVTLAGDNTFGGTNTFNNSIYAKNGVVAGDTTNYGANSVTKGSNTYSFPNKSGTFAMITDVIKDPIYFISFYANESSEPCHLIGTMMSKDPYGTGQKTNEEFAVMLASNFYVNSNEGLAAYGKLAEKDILCIYSEDGLSIRCLDEENSEVDLPTVIFFVVETEL